MKYPFVYTRQVAAGKGDDRHVAQLADLEELAGLLFVASLGAIGGGVEWPPPLTLPRGRGRVKGGGTAVKVR